MTAGYLAGDVVRQRTALSTQIKVEMLIVPTNADGFLSTVSVLRSLDGSKGVSSYTFSLPEDRCVRILVKYLGKRIPENVAHKELETLNIRIQGAKQLRRGPH